MSLTVSQAVILFVDEDKTRWLQNIIYIIYYYLAVHNTYCIILLQSTDNLSSLPKLIYNWLTRLMVLCCTYLIWS